MKANHALIILIIFALVSACGGAAESTPTATSIPPTETSIPATATEASTFTPAPPTFTPTPAMPSVAECKVQAYSFTNVGFGLPNPSHKLPSLGTVKTIVLFADFSDVPARQTPEELFGMVSPNAEKFYKDISYGKMDYVLEPHLVWLRLSQPSSHYGQGIRSYEGHLEFLQEAVTLADAEVDFSTADSVLLMVPPQARNIGYGPAFGDNAGYGYTADGKIFSNGVTSGADLTHWGFLWLNHETGHTMGLPDLYLYSSSNTFRDVGGFDLMGDIAGMAPEYVAFSRWQLGWLDDNQIYCQTDGEQTTVLSAIEIPGGIKAVIVPISDSKVLVIESRKKLGYDTKLKKEGALVYTVDTAVYSGEGTLVVQPTSGAKSTLGVGESLTVEGVTITVVESTSESDTVLVTVTK